MTKLEKIAAVKNLYNTTDGEFYIPDNCPGDGWGGTLFEDGAVLFERPTLDGEFFKYEDIDENVLDIILEEAKFEDED